MNVTDELREYAGNFYLFRYKDVREKLDAIADRIDARYQKVIRALNNLADASVLLPVDADGVPIHVGDEMEGVDKYDSLKKVMGKVITIIFESDGTVEVAIKAWSSDGKSWHRTYLDPGASVYRHYHESTVEDVLREFGDWYAHTKGGCDEDGIIAEYAAKLRLANDGKEQ